MFEGSILKPIPNHPQYSITEDGRIWSNKYKRWLKPSRGTAGHLQIGLCKNNIRVYKYIHRLVLETYIGSCPEGMECRHLNGNPADNRLENLCWGTHKENAQDMIEHGTCRLMGAYGAANPASKLSDQDRQLIKHKYATGLFTQKELGILYRVHPTTIHYVVTAKVVLKC